MLALLLLLLVMAVAVFVARGVVVVKAGERALLERLGKPHGVLDAGTHVTLPFVDAVVRRFPQVLQVSGTQRCSTADGDVVELRCTVDCAIVDVRAAHYNVGDVAQTTLNSSLTTLRAQVRDCQRAALDDAIASGRLAAAVSAELGKDAGGWGIEVKDIVVAAVVVPALGPSLGASVDGLAASALPVAVPARAGRPER